MDKQQFDALVALEEAKRTGTALPEAPAEVTAWLQERGYVDGKGAITSAGIEALEPYRAKRAVFFAAGFGSRLVPITLNTPKPMIRVHGVRIIQRLIDVVRAAGITEIYVVRGYLPREFEVLKLENPDIRFIDNPLYDSTNNISSAVAAADFMRDAYVFESDLLLRNPGLITRYQYATNYIGVPVEHTDDWCLTVENGRATHIAKGGDDCYHMFGISYWTDADGRRLADRLRTVFEREDGKQIFWDDVALNWYPDDFSVQARECTFDDVCEIDTFAELQDIDDSYRC